MSFDLSPGFFEDLVYDEAFPPEPEEEDFEPAFDFRFLPGLLTGPIDPYIWLDDRWKYKQNLTTIRGGFQYSVFVQDQSQFWFIDDLTDAAVYMSVTNDLSWFSTLGIYVGNFVQTNFDFNFSLAQQIDPRRTKFKFDLQNDNKAEGFPQSSYGNGTGVTSLYNAFADFANSFSLWLLHYGSDSIGPQGRLVLKVLTSPGTIRTLAFGNRKKKLNEMYENYVVIDEPSVTECLFKAVWKGVKFLFSDREKRKTVLFLKGQKLYKKSWAWKKQLEKGEFIQKGVMPSLDLLQNFMDYYREKKKLQFNVVVYNASFDVIREILAKSEGIVPTLRIRYVKNHAQLVIPKRQIENSLNSAIDFKSFLRTENKFFKKQTKNSDDIFWFQHEKNFYYGGKEYRRAALDEKLYREGEIDVSFKLISAKKFFEKNSELEQNVLSIDIETFTDEKGNQKPFLIGVYDGNEEEICHQWEGEDCIEQMFDFFTEMEEEEYEAVIYAHNGGKFDYFLILKHVLESEENWKLKKDSCFVICGGICAFTLECESKKLHFKDSCRLIPTSLKVAAYSFNTKHKKQEFDIEKAVKDWEGNIEEIKKYHLLDLLTLWDVMDEYRKKFYEMTNGMNVLKFMTASQAAINIFLQKYYHPSSCALWTPPLVLDKLFRNFYYGGRCELFALGHVKGVMMFFDINSLYPYSMLKKLPTSKYTIYGLEKGSKVCTTNLNQSHVLEDHFFGFVHCKVWQKNYEKWKHFPQYIPYHSSQLLLFPFIDEPFETLLFSEEIKMLQNTPFGEYEFEFINFFECEGDNFLKKCIDDLYETKKKAGLENNEAMRTTSKLTMNSLYGTFGINTQRETIRVLEENEDYILDEAFQNGELTDINQIGNTIVIQSKEIIDIACSKVDVASVITTYSRMTQWQYMCQLVQEGHEVLFGDTDSICVKINDLKKFKNSYFYNIVCKDGQKEILGKEKDELWKSGKKIMKEDFAAYLNQFDLKIEDELCPFENVLIAAAKGYYCLAEFKDYKIEKRALKGAKLNLTGQEVTYDVFKEKLIENDDLVIYQDVFKSGKPSFFDSENPLRVQIEKSNEKKFRKIYQKGKVTEENIEYKRIYPYKLSEIESVTKLPIQKYPIEVVAKMFK